MKYKLFDSNGIFVAPGDKVLIDTPIQSYICTLKEVYKDRLITTLDEFDNEEFIFSCYCIDNIESLQLTM